MRTSRCTFRENKNVRNYPCVHSRKVQSRNRVPREPETLQFAGIRSGLQVASSLLPAHDLGGVVLDAVDAVPGVGLAKVRDLVGGVKLEHEA